MLRMSGQGEVIATFAPWGQDLTWDSLAASGRRRDTLIYHAGLGPWTEEESHPGWWINGRIVEMSQNKQRGPEMNAGWRGQQLQSRAGWSSILG